MPATQKIVSVYRTAYLQNSGSEQRHSFDRYESKSSEKKEKLFKDVLKEELLKQK